MRPIANPVAILASALLAVLPTGAPAQVDDLRLMQAVEGRVAAIGYRLAVAAGDLCHDRAMLAGLQVHDASQYAAGAADDLAAAFGPGPWPKILAVVPGGAAARAGLRANDSILSVDGQPVPAAAPNGSYARVAATLALLDRGLADGEAALAIERDGKPLAIELGGQPGCASRFALRISGEKQGKADGAYVEITTGLVAFANDDAELAAAIAHELAHNILRHRARLDAEGVQRGILQNFGRNARLTRATEAEADRLSVHLLDRAGYPMDAAVRFWRRFRKASFDFGDNTHPGGKARIALIEAEIARIEADKAAGRVPRFSPGGE